MDKLGFIRNELSPDKALEDYKEYLVMLDDDINLAMEMAGVDGDEEIDDEDEMDLDIVEEAVTDEEEEDKLDRTILDEGIDTEEDLLEDEDDELTEDLIGADLAEEAAFMLAMEASCKKGKRKKACEGDDMEDDMDDEEECEDGKCRKDDDEDCEDDECDDDNDDMEDDEIDDEEDEYGDEACATEAALDIVNRALDLIL